MGDPGNDAIWIAAIVAFFGMLTASMPIIMARVTNLAARDALDAANKRADVLADRVALVALKAEDAARLLAVNTGTVAAAAKHAASSIAANTKRNGDKLDVLHLLVNSNYTAAKQAEYDATVREAATIGELIDLKRAAGKEPTLQTVAALEAANIKITELRTELDERIKQAKAVTAQQEIQKVENAVIAEGEAPG